MGELIGFPFDLRVDLSIPCAQFASTGQIILRPQQASLIYLKESCPRHSLIEGRLYLLLELAICYHRKTIGAFVNRRVF